jgi:thymidine phosphorylase
MRPGIFFLVVGPSGVGKDTLIDGARAVLGADPRYLFATRVITRAADAGGERHAAVTQQEFAAREQAGGFLLSWSAHGLRYGLPVELLSELEAGRHVVANGSRATIARMAALVPRLVVVSVNADRAALAQRIAARGRESGEEIALRLDREVDAGLIDRVEVLNVANDGSIDEGVERFVAALEGASKRLHVVAFAIDTWRHAVAYLPPNSLAGAADYLGPERVEIVGGGRSIRASVHVVGANEGLAADEIGLSRQAFEDLALPAGAAVAIHRSPAPESRSALRAKIRGEALSEDQYAGLLSDIVQGRYPDSEVGAFLVAATRDLGDDEVVALARVRAGFTKRLDWNESIVVDKHSMGGIPGSRITLIVIPIVAAHGLTIPKTSSCAITSAAGTADAMDVVARVDLSAQQLLETVRRTRGCIAWNGRLNHSVLDDVMNGITRPLGLETNRWSVASILSKKLAAGASHVIVDLPFGPQAKLKTRQEADELASLFERVGRALGLTVEAHATDGSAPIGRGVGPALEVRDVLQVLDNAAGAPADLREKALFFAGRILTWDRSLGGPVQARARAEQLLATGQARASFDAIVDAQGRRSPPIAPGRLTHVVRARSDARVGTVDFARITEVARSAGAPQDRSAGIDLLRRPGDEVRAGDALYVIHSSAAADLDRAAASASRDCGIALQYAHIHSIAADTVAQS